MIRHWLYLHIIILACRLDGILPPFSPVDGADAWNGGGAADSVSHQSMSNLPSEQRRVLFLVPSDRFDDGRRRYLRLRSSHRPRLHGTRRVVPVGHGTRFVINAFVVL